MELQPSLPQYLLLSTTRVGIASSKTGFPSRVLSIHSGPSGDGTVGTGDGIGSSGVVGVDLSVAQATSTNRTHRRQVPSFTGVSSSLERPRLDDGKRAASCSCIPLITHVGGTGADARYLTGAVRATCLGSLNRSLRPRPDASHLQIYVAPDLERRITTTGRCGHLDGTVYVVVGACPDILMVATNWSAPFYTHRQNSPADPASSPHRMCQFPTQTLSDMCSLQKPSQSRGDSRLLSPLMRRTVGQRFLETTSGAKSLK